MMFSSILGFDPSEVLLPSKPQLDDDYLLEYEERLAHRRQANWFYDPDCDDWAHDDFECEEPLDEE